jgi:hypothetical protein
MPQNGGTQMTAQRHDYLFIDGERRRIAAAAPVPFAPNALGLRLGGSPAKSCCRGSRVGFELDGATFKIKELWLAPHHGDREALLRGKLFDRAPNIVDESSMTFKGISLPYTGKLLVAGSKTHISGALQDAHEIFRLVDGRFKSREKVKLQELPDEFTPSSVSVDYGSMLWVLPDPSELENT